MKYKDLEDKLQDDFKRTMGPRQRTLREALQQALDETTVDTPGDPLDTRDTQSDNSDWAGWIAKCLREKE